MYSEGVFVQVEHPKFGSSKGSGLQINNIVITHGGLLAPLCFPDNNSDDMIERYSTIVNEIQNVNYNVDLQDDLIKFKVLHKNYYCIGKNKHKAHNLTCKSCSSEDYTLEEAQFCTLFNYTGMLDISTEISNWTNCINTCDESDEHQLGYLLLPKFIFLVVGTSSEALFEKSLHTVFNSLKNAILYPGLPLVIESTPFSNYSFINSWSRGIISKLIGPVNDGILTDARLVSGCEGGAIYTFENEVKGQLIGIVVQTISWCNGEWVGFSLGLSIKHLLKAVLGLQSTVDYIPFNKLLQNFPSSLINIDKLAASVVFVRCHNKWGSGVVINKEMGLILTCSHIIHHDHNAVIVFCEGGQYSASIVYSSPSSTPYDLALLLIGKVPGLKEFKLAETPPVLGERVVAAGYPLSTQSSVALNRTPTLSTGCVAKVSRRGGPLQTTCCTQSGLSGGALLRPPDQLLGIVVSNVRLDSTTMPSFSFAVSVEDLREPISQYLATKDPSFLQSLCQESCAVKMEWSLIDCKL